MTKGGTPEKALIEDGKKDWYLRPSDVTERDVDLLLLEELHASPDFRAHFLNLLNGLVSPASLFVSGEHSVANSSGQSDLEIAFCESSGKKCRILIENKIDASFQPEQARRYMRRGELHIRAGLCERFVTVLVAPERYIGTAAHGFDSAVSYEDLIKWFETAIHLGDRQACKLEVLRAGIVKAERGVVSKSKNVTEFGIAYYELVQELAPELCMLAPKPRSSGFMLLHPPATNGFRFVHKVSYGHVDIEFAGFGSRVGEVRAAFNPVLPPDLKIVKANKSAAIRATVPCLAKEVPVKEQIVDARTSIIAARDLLKWWTEHRKCWLGRSSTGRI